MRGEDAMSFCARCGVETPDEGGCCPDCGFDPAEPAIEADFSDDSEEEEIGDTSAWTAAVPRAPSLHPRRQGTTDGPVRIVSAQAIEPLSRRLNRNVFMAVAFAVVIVAIVVAVNVVGRMSRPYDINARTFPDSGVRKAVSTVDTDGDGKISREEASALTELEISGATNISGLGIFPNLTSLTATGNNLSNIDVSDLHNLVVLDISGTGVSSLNLSSNRYMETLDVSDTLVSELDLSALTALESLDITGTEVSSIDVSGNTSLQSLMCDQGVQISGLDSTVLREYWLVTEFTAYMSTSNYSVSADLAYEATGMLSSISYTENGEVVSSSEFTYDSEGRMTMAIYSSDSESESWQFTYDDQGRLSTATDVAGHRVLAYGYDEVGRLISCTETNPDSGREVAEVGFEYDSEDRISRMVSDDTIVFTYNEQGALSSVEFEDGGFSCTYEYDADGRCTVLVCSYSGSESFEERFEYDSDGNLSNATRTVESSWWSWLFGGDLDLEEVSEMSFGRDSFGNIVSATATLESDGLTDTCEVELTRVLATEESSPVQVGYMRGDPLWYCIGWYASWSPWDVIELMEDPDALLRFSAAMVFDGASEWQGSGNPMSVAALALGSAADAQAADGETVDQSEESEGIGADSE